MLHYLLWKVTLGAKNKKAVVKSRTSPNSSSFDSELPSTSKESSPAILPPVLLSESEHYFANTEQENVLERKKFKEQLTFSCGNPFVENVRGILHLFKEKYYGHLYHEYFTSCSNRV